MASYQPHTPITDFDKLASSWRMRLKERRHHNLTRQYWSGCVAVDTMSREQLLALQQDRLDDLVSHAAAHVPFYQSWAAKSGFKCGDRVALTDLPITSKADYTTSVDAFQSDAYPASTMSSGRTSGSSGEPFRFRTHPKSTDYSYACLLRALHRFGLRPGDPRVFIWGRSYSFANTPIGIAKKKIILGVRNWLNVTHAIDAYDLNPSNVAAAIVGIERFNPVYIHGYVSAIYTIARALLDQGRTLHAPRLIAVVTESEKLYPFQKDAMRLAFGTPILENYGSVELGKIAQPDPDGHMRINEDLFIVERTPTGEAVITNLMTHAFPFIRYKLGDLIELEPEIPPGLPYACFRSIVGRTVDMIPIPTGGHIHGVALAHAIDPHLEHVLKYQIQQTALDRFTVRLVPKGELPPRVAETIRTDLRALVGQNATIEVVAVDHIEPAASGKFRWVISDLTKPPTTTTLSDTLKP